MNTILPHQLQEINSFVREANQEYRARFESLLCTDAPHGVLREEIQVAVLRLLDKYPSFEYLEDTIDGPLIIFERPKPIEAWWWKGGDGTRSGGKTSGWIDGNCPPSMNAKHERKWGERMGEHTQKAIVHGKAIEWGHYYRESMPSVYAIRDNLILRLKILGLNFKRLNDKKAHSDPRGYYIWQVCNT